jgi:hypothetical protein
MTSLAEDVALLRAQVDYLLERLTDADGLGATPIAWCSLDRDQAREEWALLAGWVDWLVDRYGLAERVPLCWYRHGAMHEELSALRTAWLGAYEAPNARPTDGVTWHDMLDRVVVRLREWDRCGCHRGTHRDDTAAGDDDDAIQERTSYIRTDVQTRPGPRTQPPNEPTLL